MRTGVGGGSRPASVRLVGAVGLAAALIAGCGGAPASSGSVPSSIATAAPSAGTSPASTGSTSSPAPSSVAEVPSGVFAQTLEEVPFRISLPSGWRLGGPGEQSAYWAWLGEALPEFRSLLEKGASIGAGNAFIAYDGTEVDARDPSLYCSTVARGTTSPAEALDKAERDNLELLGKVPWVTSGPVSLRLTLPAGEAARISWRESALGVDLSSVGYLVVVGPHLVTCVFRAPSAELTERQKTWDGVARSIASKTAWEASATVEVGVKPFEAAVGAGSIWIANADSSEISRIDPSTNRVRTFAVKAGPSGQSGLWDIAVADGRAWVTAIVIDAAGEALPGKLLVIDTATDRIVKTIPVGRAPMGVTVALGAVWVANTEDGTISRVDPRTFKVTTLDVAAAPLSLVATEDALWVAHSDGTLTRIDPATSKATVFSLPDSLQALAVGSRGLWVSGQAAVYLVDTAHGRVLATVKVSAAAGLAARDGTVWAVESAGLFLRQIDEASAKVVDSVQLATNSWGLVELDGTLWVVHPAAPDRKFAEYAPGTVTRLDR